MKLAEQIELVCLMEATARKPGNVHPGASFDDLRYDDFVRAAQAVANPLAAASSIGVGRAILHAVQETHAATGTNVNLGIVLLLAPLAAVAPTIPLDVGMPRILEQTTIEDAEYVYAAIRIAQPGGMGDAPSQDIRDQPTVTLRNAMALAADRDRIAEQYVTNHRLVFQARSKLCQLFKSSIDWETAVIALQIWMMSCWPDTLIARKCGRDLAQQVLQRANAVVETLQDDGTFDQRQLAEFDAWLRQDGHRRNPGTTADLIAATLFAAARDGLIELPSRREIQQLATKIQNRQI